MNIKKYLKFLIVCLSIILVVIMIISSGKEYKNNSKNIYAIIDDQTYSLKDINKKYGNNFIRTIDSEKVVIYNGETTYTCKYNEKCEIWPDSENGQIMWAAPLVTITFNKE